MHFNTKALALAGGILWGASILVLTLISSANGYGAEMLTMLTHVYPGYEISPLGSVIGLVWGFFDAGICMLLFGLLYNWLLKKVK